MVANKSLDHRWIPARLRIAMQSKANLDLTPTGAPLKRSSRLALRISIALTLVFTLCVLVFSLTAWWINTINAAGKERAVFQQSKIWVQKVFAEPVWSYNEDLLSELAQVMIASPDGFVRELEVKDRDGLTIVDVSDGTEHEQGDLVEEFRISHQREVVGSVRMRARAQGVLDLFEGIQVFIWVAATLVSVTMAIVSFLVLDRLLSRPLEELIANLDQVERANYKIKLNQAYAGELATLAKAFQRAIRGIEQRDTQLSRYASNLEDLVDARTAERDRERMNSLNTAKLASIGEVSAGLAHEINNPLTVIQGTVSLIENHLEKLTPKTMAEVGWLKSHLEKISMMVLRINSIVKSLKYFARDGGSDPRLEFSVNRMLEEVINLLSMRMRQYQISFKADLPGEEIRISGQEVQISQVVVNLLQNSIDAVKSREVREVTLKLSKTDTHCCVRVSDSGYGVSREIVEKIFQPFFTTKAVGEGTGIGLSIAHGIIQQHGGEILLVSESGPTVFEVRIPFAIEA